MRISICIPTLNAGEIWHELVKSINYQYIEIAEKLIIDSGSEDDTIKTAQENGFNVVSISRADFNHGGTRNLGIELLKASDIIIFLTQDVILANEHSLKNLLKPFEDPKVACVYGRQLPHKNGNPLAIHAREYNYPNKTQIKDLSMISEIGFKVSHISNAFSAYKTFVFKDIDTFPTNVIIAEDTFLASKIIKKGLKIVYNAEASVYHSHNYSPMEEFRRYFDTGVFHQQNSWIRNDFGQPNGEGFKYLMGEINYVLKNNPSWIIKAFISNGMKWLGFKLGLIFKYIPIKLINKLTMNKNYWKIK